MVKALYIGVVHPNNCNPGNPRREYVEYVHPDSIYDHPPYPSRLHPADPGSKPAAVCWDKDTPLPRYLSWGTRKVSTKNQSSPTNLLPKNYPLVI